MDVYPERYDTDGWILDSSPYFLKGRRVTTILFSKSSFLSFESFDVLVSSLSRYEYC